MKNTVVLIHGFTDSPRRIFFMARYLRRLGWNVLTPELRPSNGSAPLETLAEQLATFVSTHCGDSGRLDFIGFSMGGLICRYYLQCMGGAARTDRFISIASPDNGTHIAKLIPGAGMRQMRRGSTFLNDLNADVSTLKDVACSVLFTPMDFIIVPAVSSIVPFAEIYRLRIFSHVLMIYHPAVYRKLAALLETPSKREI